MLPPRRNFGVRFVFLRRFSGRKNFDNPTLIGRVGLLSIFLSPSFRILTSRFSTSIMFSADSGESYT